MAFKGLRLATARALRLRHSRPVGYRYRQSYCSGHRVPTGTSHLPGCSSSQSASSWSCRAVQHQAAKRSVGCSADPSVFAANRPATADSMQLQLADVISMIHSSPTKAVIYLTGGGSQALAWLLTVPGASRTILDARVPYAPASLEQLLGQAPSSAASAETAVLMARAALRAAADLTPFGASIVGVGCTAALVTDRARRGEDKAFVATATGAGVSVYSLRMAKGTRGRAEEDELVSRLLVRALARVCGAGGGPNLDLGLPPPGGLDATAESLEVSEEAAEEAVGALLNGRARTAEFSGGGVLLDAPRPRRIYLPGSFNPLHDGHKQMLEAAMASKPGIEGCFELSVGNPDKGMLPHAEVKRRVEQFTALNLPLIVTQTPLFTQKAELFPGSTFVVGYDTAVRLVKPEYYGDETAMLLQFAALRLRGCSFLVAGRRIEDAFKTIDDVVIPETLQRGGLFEGIPESAFRMDLSSTELRNQGRGLS